MYIEHTVPGTKVTWYFPWYTQCKADDRQTGRLLPGIE